MPDRLTMSLALIVFLLPAVANAQSTATYITPADIDTVRAAPDQGLDRQVRVVDIGHANVAVGILHREAMRSDDGVSGIVHAQVTEVYYIVSGGGTLVTGGTLVDPEPRAVDSPSVTVLVGPSTAGIGRGGQSRRVSPGDIVVIPAGVFHGFSEIDDHVTYLSIRPDPDKVLPAGYVNPALAR